MEKKWYKNISSKAMLLPKTVQEYTSNTFYTITISCNSIFCIVSVDLFFPDDGEHFGEHFSYHWI